MAEEVLKECQLCHKLLPKENFYDRKDRNGEYTWKRSYCGSCNNIIISKSKSKKADYYREKNNDYKNNYYHQNKEKVQIVQKRYYYNKLPKEKKEKYKQKLKEKYPEFIDKIFAN